MKIGFFGSGNMSRVLGGAWAVAGHSVLFGSRSAQKAEATAREIGHGTEGASNDDVASRSEIIVHSVREVPSRFLITTAPLAGKVIIDLNNRDFPRTYVASELLQSLAEATQKDVPSAMVVKALNNQAMEVFNAEADKLKAAGIQTFIAGDSADAKASVIRLIADIGLSCVDFGPLSNAWLLEAQADILRTHMFASGNFLATPGFIQAPAASPRFGERKKGAY